MPITSPALLFIVATPLFLTLGWLTAERFPPWISWHSEVWAFAAAITGAIVGLAHLKARKIKLVVLPVSVWVGALVCSVVCIQYTTGEIVFFGDALVIVFYIVVCLVVLVMGRYAGACGPQLWQTASGYPAFETLAATILLGAACSAGIALAQVLQVADGVAWIAPMSRRPGGNFGQPNQLATFLLMGFASLLYLFESRRLQGVSALAVCALLACGFAVTESRTGLLSMVLLASWWLSRYRVLAFRASPLVMLLGVAVCIALFWSWPPLYTYFNAGGLTPDAIAKVNTDGTSRTVVWPQLFDAVLQRPWFGWGLGQVSKAHNAALHGNYLTSEPFTYAHNIVLDLAVGVGLPLTALAVGGCAVWLWRCVHATRALLPWYCLALIFPFGVHSMLEFPFAYAYFLVPVMFVIGVLGGIQAHQRTVRIPWSSAVVTLSVASAVMAWSAWEYLLLEEDFRIARFESMQVGKTPSEYERPTIYLLTQLDAFVQVARIKPAPSMSTQQVELLHDVAMKFPYLPMQNRYALSLALNGNAKEAIAQLKVMQAMHYKKDYVAIRQYWHALAATDYPQLKMLEIP